MLAVLLILILPFGVFSECYFPNITNFDYDNPQRRIKCVPELTSGNIASPSTVCVMTCKQNNLRFKHRCNRDGNWDVAPDLSKCGQVVQCGDPKKHWKLWNFRCSGFTEGSKCLGQCGLVPETKVEINCKKNGDTGAWRPEHDLEYCPSRGKLMVVGGYEGNEVVNTVDIIDLDNQSSLCQASSNYNITARYIQSGVLNIMGKPTPIFCGGQGLNCYTYSALGFEASQSMKYDVEFSASTVQRCVSNSEETCLWITGGIYNEFGKEATSDIVQVVNTDAVKEDFKLPSKLEEHCVVGLSNDTIMTIGGYNEAGIYQNTYIYNFKTNNSEVGSKLPIDKTYFTCGVQEIGDQLIVYVIGGRYFMNGTAAPIASDSVEVAVLDKNNIEEMNWNWSSGSLILIAEDRIHFKI